MKLHYTQSVESYTQIVIAFLDSMSSSVADIDSDFEIIAAIANGWEDTKSRKELAVKLHELADRLAT